MLTVEHPIAIRLAFMRLLAILFVVLIVALQWPLWIGKGSWLKVWQLENQVTEQHKANEKLKARNAALDAEVKDLKTGVDAIEERARNELGMIRSDEVFFQILDHSATLAPKTSETPKPVAQPSSSSKLVDTPSPKPAPQVPAQPKTQAPKPAPQAVQPEMLSPGVAVTPPKSVLPPITQPQKPIVPVVPKPASPKEPQR